jgi:hypothetical protein
VFLGFFDENTNQWVWKNLNFDKNMQYDMIFYDCAFDNKGRLWVSGLYKNNRIDKSSIAFTWVISNKDKYQVDMKYTSENSNLRAGSLIAAGDYIWQRGYHLTRINTNEILPRPISENEAAWLKYVSLRYYALIALYGLGYLITSQGSFE